MQSFADAFNTKVNEEVRATAVEVMMIVTDTRNARHVVASTPVQVIGSLSEILVIW